MPRIKRSFLWIAFVVPPILAWGMGARSARSDDDKPAPAKPAARFAPFATGEGEVTVLETYEVGKVPLPDLADFFMNVDLYRRTQVRSGEETFYVRLFSNGAPIAEEDLESFAAALAYFRKNRAKQKADARTYSEFTYFGKSGLQAGYYVEPAKGKTADFVRVGDGQKTTFIKNLADLESAIGEARMRISELRGAK